MDTPIVGIGASAGGLEALTDTLSRADLSANLAFVIVQHLDPNHQSMLAELLARQTGLRVRQIEGGETVQSANVYIIPPGKGLEIEGGVLKLVEFKQGGGCVARSTISSCLSPTTSVRTPPA